MTSLLQRLRHLLLTLVLGGCILVWGNPVFADAGTGLNSRLGAELQASLEQAHDPQRLADLQALQDAITTSDDRAQLNNQSSHNLGIFARYNKDPADAPAQFYVLAPGHTTDDDYELLGLLIPPQVVLAWGESGSIETSKASRVMPILEGEQLKVSDPATADSSTTVVAYELSLPAYSLDTSLAGAGTLPELSQSQLDQEAETAPLD